MINNTYKNFLNKINFIPILEDNPFGPNGTCYRLSNRLGKGIFWIYNPNDMFDIKIHDFYYYENQIFNNDLPEGLSVTYYESISGEEIFPYKQFSSNVVRTHIGGKKSFKAIIHKNIPIKCVGIEIKPSYYNDYLKKKYPGEFDNLEEIFRSFEDTSNFPEMINLLTQLKNFKGKGASAKLFYESKIIEAISLMVKYHKNYDKAKVYLSYSDKEIIYNLNMYINNHYTEQLNQSLLTQIAGMCSTKLKKTFKTINDCTITEYIQSCRINKAKYLLQSTDLTINQISRMVGYKDAGYFSELFKRETGVTPIEYKKNNFY
ncbi:MAG: helix-turn-helix domain-containing protein [Sphaerochaeta sp.]